LEFIKCSSLRVADEVLEYLQKDESVTNIKATVGVFANGREQGLSLFVEDTIDHTSDDVWFFFAEHRSSDDVVVYETKELLGNSTPYPEDMWVNAKYFTRDPKAASEHIASRIKLLFVPESCKEGYSNGETGGE
jgi:hypothetical protein